MRTQYCIFFCILVKSIALSPDILSAALDASDSPRRAGDCTPRTLERVADRAEEIIHALIFDTPMYAHQLLTNAEDTLPICALKVLLTYKETREGNTLLMRAVQTHHVPLVRSVLTLAERVFTDPRELRQLFLTTNDSGSNALLISLLLKSPHSPKTVSLLLDAARHKGHMPRDEMRDMLQIVNHTNRSSLLLLAAEHEDEEIIRLLFTAAHEACMSNEEFEAMLTHTDAHHESVLLTAVRHKNPATLLALLHAARRIMSRDRLKELILDPHPLYGNVSLLTRAQGETHQALEEFVRSLDEDDEDIMVKPAV